METTERKTPMLTLHRGGYIPLGCDQQGRLETGDYIRERQEQAADMARLCGADTESAEDTVRRMPCLPGSAEQIARVVCGGAVVLIAVVAVGSLLVAVFA